MDSALDLEVVYQPVVDELPNATSPYPWLDVTDDAVLVRMNHDVRLLVQSGRRVTIDIPRTPEWTDRDTSWFVTGWGAALAHLQRGGLSLHATTVEIDGEVIAIAGASGAGKSTTGLALAAAGHTLLVDDLARIDLRDDGAWVRPFGRNVHVLPEAAAALNLNYADLPRLAGGKEKAALTPEPPPPDPRRIAAVVILEPAADAQQVSVLQLRGAQRLRAVAQHTNGAAIPTQILGRERFFRALTGLASMCPVYVLTRPTERWSMDEVINAIEGIVANRRVDP